MTAFPTYETGTVAVANGATAIIGAGAIWSGVNARSGDDVVIAGHTVVVMDVADTGHLQIDPWPYADVPAGTAYKIIQRSPLRFVGGQAMADVSALVGALNTDGWYVFVPSIATVPDPSLGNDGQYAFQATTGKLWIKDGGVWTFLNIYKAFGAAAPWNAATNYQINDIATLAGTSYLARIPSTNQTPPNATHWAVLAAKGDTGAPGTDGSPGADGADGTPGTPGTNGTNGIGYGGTSTTSLAIAVATKVFTTQAGLGYNGARVRAASAANPVNYMEGVCTYSGTILTMTVDAVGGSGTKADWLFSVAGQPGTAGGGTLLSANALSELSGVADAARLNIGIKQSTVIVGAADLNTIIAPGTYACQTNTCTNGPTVGGQWYIDVIVNGGDPTNYLMQRAVSLLGDGGEWNRIKLAGTWQAWRKVIVYDTLAALTAGDFGAAVAAKPISPSDVKTGLAYVALTDAAPIAWNLANGINFNVAIGASRTINFPTNVANAVGRTGYLEVLANGGAFALSFQASVGFTFDGGVAPTNDNVSGRFTQYVYHIRSATEVRIGLAFKGVR